jgi:hypothetical protein
MLYYRREELTMMYSLSEFYYKLTALFKYLNSEYNQPKLQLLTIDISPRIESCLVHFFDNKSKGNFCMNLRDLFKNKILLKNFSNMDAAEIGASYGKLLAKNH